MVISLIVPVYNCEKYLNNCITSLISQTYPQIEIILVDDGATDRSPEICDQFSQTDKRIKVIHKKNGGVSSARNAGLSECTGDYITFIDSDDWIDLDACAKAAKLINGDEELVIWNFKRWKKGKLTNEYQEILPWNSISEMVSDIIAAKRNQNYMLRACWAKMYRRDILQEVTFPEQQYIGEDACFILECMQNVSHISKVKVIQDAWYNYNTLPTSATRRYKPDLLDQLSKEFVMIQGIIDSMHISSRKCVKTAMTIYSWQAYYFLERNQIRCGNKSLLNEDLNVWRSLAGDYMKGEGINCRNLPRFTFFCWFTDKFLPDIFLRQIVKMRAEKENNLAQGEQHEI